MYSMFRSCVRPGPRPRADVCIPCVGCATARKIVTKHTWQRVRAQNVHMHEYPAASTSWALCSLDITFIYMTKHRILFEPWSIIEWSNVFHLVHFYWKTKENNPYIEHQHKYITVVLFYCTI